MATKTFAAKNKLKSGTQEITIQADNYFKAKELIEGDVIVYKPSTTGRVLSWLTGCATLGEITRWNC